MYNNNSNSGNYGNYGQSSRYGQSSYGSRPQQYSNQRSNSSYPQQSGNQRSASGYSQQQTQAPKIEAAPLPADYVDKAEEVMRKLTADRQCVTTRKIRNLLSLVSNIYNAENIRTGEEITPESVTNLTMMRIRIVYEVGRDQTVKDFVREAKLLEYLKDIGTSRQKLISFAHYMEALVAYHRFLGGREN